MGALLFCHFQVKNMKFVNEKNSLINSFSKWHGLPHSIMFFIFSLLCCKYICDIYFKKVKKVSKLSFWQKNLQG